MVIIELGLPGSVLLRQTKSIAGAAEIARRHRSQTSCPYEKLGFRSRNRDSGGGRRRWRSAGTERQVAVDAVSRLGLGRNTYKDGAQAGRFFCSISEAIRDHPELVRKYLGSVVPITDNFFATLNSAVFTDGSFVYVPPSVRCPMELSTYFRINAENTGQFERTLIIADKGAHVSYLEGCTAPQRDTTQLHAAVVELVALEDASIKYSTVQNWFPGDEQGRGGIYNFVTKRADCRGDRARVMWTQVETGSAVTWKYPSCILRGRETQGEFYSIAITNNFQQADTGTKMIHRAPTHVQNVRKAFRKVIPKHYRGLVSVHPRPREPQLHANVTVFLIARNVGNRQFL